jgi:acylpyruvate hydrolase
MKLATFIPRGGNNGTRIGAVYEGSQILDLAAAYALSLQGKEADPRSRQVAAALLPSDMIAFCDGLPQTLSRAETAMSYAHELAKKNDPRLKEVLHQIKDITLKAPLPRPRGIGIGYFNQKGIIEEASRAETEKKTGKKTEGIQMDVVYPEIAVISWSSPRCVIGPDEAIVFPKISKKIFNSIELGVVIGREAYKVPKSKADDYILGYTVTSDITAFDLVQKENFVYTCCRCKSMPTFWPTGPWIVTKDEIKDPMNLEALVRINGKEVMKGNSKYYTFSPQDYVADVSQYMILEAGTIIAMGAFNETTFTFPNVGDVVENEIEGIGILRNHVVAEQP